MRTLAARLGRAAALCAISLAFVPGAEAAAAPTPRKTPQESAARRPPQEFNAADLPPSLPDIEIILEVLAKRDPITIPAERGTWNISVDRRRPEHPAVNAWRTIGFAVRETTKRAARGLNEEELDRTEHSLERGFYGEPFDENAVAPEFVDMVRRAGQDLDRLEEKYETVLEPLVELGGLDVAMNIAYSPTDQAEALNAFVSAADALGVTVRWEPRGGRP